MSSYVDEEHRPSSWIVQWDQVDYRQSRKELYRCNYYYRKNDGEKVIIPRMNLVPSNPELPFKSTRRQFLLAFCFAMTINKS